LILAPGLSGRNSSAAETVTTDTRTDNSLNSSHHGGPEKARRISRDGAKHGGAETAKQIGTDKTHHAPAGSGSVLGPKINPDAIPKGAAGASVPLVRPTDEKPAGGDGTGAFRTVCAYSHMNWDDPLLYPGRKGAAHLHTFFGNTLTDAFSTASSLRNTGNSTCRGGTVNRSAYWVPSLIDAEGNPQPPVGASIYYKTGYSGIAPKDVRPFPMGLRMLAGNQEATSAQDSAHWGCSHAYIGHPATIPDCGSGNSVTLAVGFPQCWDGVNLDSPDHRSHMAYPEKGACPSTHPNPIPAITLVIAWLTPPNGMKGWRLSSDIYDANLPGGYSAHGDLIEAWDPDIVKAFVENCDNLAVDCHSHLLGDGREIYDP
jgi:hypothetical protein